MNRISPRNIVSLVSKGVRSIRTGQARRLPRDDWNRSPPLRARGCSLSVTNFRLFLSFCFLLARKLEFIQQEAMPPNGTIRVLLTTMPLVFESSLPLDSLESLATMCSITSAVQVEDLEHRFYIFTSLAT